MLSFFEEAWEEQCVVDKCAEDDADETCKFYQVYCQTFGLQLVGRVLIYWKSDYEADEPDSCSFAHDHQTSGKTIIVLSDGHAASISKRNSQNADDHQQRQYPVGANLPEETIDSFKEQVSMIVVDA